MRALVLLLPLLFVTAAHAQQPCMDLKRLDAEVQVLHRSGFADAQKIVFQGDTLKALKSAVLASFPDADKNERFAAPTWVAIELQSANVVLIVFIGEDGCALGRGPEHVPFNVWRALVQVANV